MTRYPDLTAGPGLTDLAVSAPGWGDWRVVHAFRIDLAWEIGGAGSLSADVTVQDAWAVGGDPLIKLRGMWVWYGHPDAGDWAGVITDVVPGAADGVVEIAARGWIELVEKRLLPRVGRPPSGAPGGVVRWAIGSVGEEGGHPFRSLLIDEVGDDVTLELRGQTLAQAIARVASQSGQEWGVDAYGDFAWSDRLGCDLRREVELVAGVHVVDGTVPMSLAPVENAIHVTPADERYASARGFWLEDAASIEAVGRREGARAFAGAVTQSTLRPLGMAALRKAVLRGRTARFEVVNEDRCFGWFNTGDTVRVVLPHADMAIALRVLVSSLRLPGDVLTISGTWT